MTQPADFLVTLGFYACDRVTGFRGVATSISFDLYGCVQVLLTPSTDGDGKPRDPGWFDVSRVSPLCREREMEPPEVWLGARGPAEKPAP